LLLNGIRNLPRRHLRSAALPFTWTVIFIAAISNQWTIITGQCAYLSTRSEFEPSIQR
jgi:TRAP-type C4-dicarboxylate transport system permease small subunit